MQEQEYDNVNGIKETTDEVLPEGIGERIAWLRRSEGMTQAQLADKLGISAQAVSKWESGQSCPDIMMLLPLAGIFDVSTDMLLGAAAMNVRDDEGNGSAAEEAAKMMEIVAKAIDDESGGRERSQASADSGRTEQEQPETKKETDGKAAELRRPEDGFAKEDRFQKTQEADNGNEEDCQQERAHKTKPVHIPEGEICDLRLNLGAAEAFIREGDSFSLRMIGYDDGEFTSVVSDGVWKISDGGYRAAIFGFRSLFRGRKAVITIPAGYRFREVHFSMGAGTITGESIAAKECVLNVGAGQMTLLNFDCEGTDMKCGMGEIKIDGTLTGRCRIDCGMGSVAANLTPIEDYGYDLSVGMGDVKIGDDGFSGMSGKHRMNRNAENFFKITCGMGAVNIRFKKKKFR